MTGPRVRRRERQREELTRRWEQNKDQPLPVERRAELGVDRDAIKTKLTELSRWPNRKKFTGRDIEQILQRTFSLTEATDFQAALGAWRRNGLNTPGSLKKTLQRRLRAPLVEACIRQIDARPPGCKVREAAEKVAADFGIDGASFEAVTDDLRKAYYRRPRARLAGAGTLAAAALVAPALEPNSGPNRAPK